MNVLTKQAPRLLLLFILTFALLSGCTGAPDDAPDGGPDTGTDASYPPIVMVDGVLYQDTGYLSSMPRCGVMDGAITSEVPPTQLPAENDQSNFGTGYEYQWSSEGQLIVLMNQQDHIFRDTRIQETAIPEEVRQFTARVKAIQEDGTLLLTYVSAPTEFVAMQEGDYLAPLDNLQGPASEGDLVTVWFYGLDEDADSPIPLTTVYRITPTSEETAP